MKSKLLVLLAACLALSAADSDDGPFEFLFDRCQDADDVSACVVFLFRGALDDARPKFSTGFEFGDRMVVLEPLKMPKPPAGGRSKKLDVTKAQLAGLSQMQLNSTELTSETVAAKVQFPELAAEMSGKVYYGFLPLRATLKLSLVNPRLRVKAQYTTTSEGLQLVQPHAELWLESYNLSISGMGSLGKTIATTVNDKHEEIFEFLKPSLEAAIARRVGKLSQDERNTALGWLESVLG